MNKDIAERIVKIRKEKNMTQTQFADKLNATRPKIAAYELAKVNFDQSFLALICEKFDINEDWLHAGEGEMYNTVSDEELSKIAERYNLSDAAKNFIKKFIELEEEEMNAVLKFMGNISSDETEQAADVESKEQEKPWNVGTDKVRAALDRQEKTDKTYNNGSKKEKLSS